MAKKIVNLPPDASVVAYALAGRSPGKAVRNSAWHLRADGTKLELAAKPTLAVAQRLVGGYVELSRGRDAAGRVCQLLCNEDGYALGLRPNLEATKLYHGACRPGTTHMIVGDVVVLYGWRFA